MTQQLASEAACDATLTPSITSKTSESGGRAARSDFQNRYA